MNRSSFEFDEYTIFLYTFSVITAIPRTIEYQPYHSIVGISVFIIGIFSPIWLRLLPNYLPRILLMRIFVWLMLVCSIFVVAQATGRQEARDVLARQARQVNVFFTHDFATHLVASLGQSAAKQRIEAIRIASESGALALIWRNNSETIFLLFGTQGDHYGKPLEIFRINNSLISMISSYPPLKRGEKI